MDRLERNENPLARVVYPTKAQRQLVVDVARLEHEALIGRWSVRLGCAVLLGYVVGVMAGWIP